MFRFEDPQYLYLLLVIPLLAIIWFVTNRNQKKRLRKFGDPKLLHELMPDVSRWRPCMKFWLLEAALTLLVLMLARPQMGTRISHEKRTGIETVICLDISNSMRAEDVTPSRLDRAKMMIENLVDHFTDDRIGLIVFAGDAFVQLPITSDYVSAKMFLSNIDPSMMATQGTDVARAVEMASHSFTQEKGIGKAIIVITDGEDHEGGAVEAADAAKKAGMRVYLLGIGSTKGSPIPIPGTGDYMTDNTGQTVMSALNEDMCKQIAAAGGGAYIHIENNSNAQDLLDQELDKLSKKETQATVYSDYDEQFQAFAILALLLLVVEMCILESRNPISKRFSLFGRKTTATLCLLVIALSTSAQTDRQLVRQGNKLFRSGDFAAAEVSYRKALEKNDRNAQALYNLGNALMAQNKDSAAVVEFEKATKVETNERRKSMAYHNIGVVCQRHQMFGEAIEAYKQSLRINPHDDETRYNLELCKRQQKQQDKDKKDNKDKKDKHKQQKQDQQKQDQQKQQEQKQQEQQKQEPKMSKENAEQLLNAAMQQEKQTQERMKKAQQQPPRRNIQKNW